MATFTAEVFQNEYLAPNTDIVDAVVTVSVTGAPAAAPAGAATEIIIVDTSGSMNEEGGRKMAAARAATVAAINCIRDGVSFAVIGGREHANLIYPRRGLAVASKSTTMMVESLAMLLIEAASGRCASLIFCATNTRRSPCGLEPAGRRG